MRTRIRYPTGGWNTGLVLAIWLLLSSASLRQGLAAPVLPGDGQGAVLASKVAASAVSTGEGASSAKPLPALKTAGATSGWSDQQLQRRVRRWLRDDPLTRAFAARATVKNGIVTLLGETWNRKASQAAADAVVHLRGIVGVRNLIVVRSDPDLEIAKTLRHRLSEDSSVGGATVAVTVFNGAVFLSGTARTAEERTRATEIAAAIPGVKQVSNGLQVSGPSVRPPVRPPVATRSYPYSGYRRP